MLFDAVRRFLLRFVVVGRCWSFLVVVRFSVLLCIVVCDFCGCSLVFVVVCRCLSSLVARWCSSWFVVARCCLFFVLRCCSSVFGVVGCGT